MNKKKIIKRIFMIAVISGLLFTHFYVPRVITEIKNPVVGLFRGKVAKKKINDLPTGTQKIQIQSFDAAMISAYFTPSPKDTAKGTLILLHGIRSGKEHFLDLSAKLSALGYNAVALDSRGHGESGGQHCTFGVKEKKDIKAVIDYLQKEKNISANIGVWGQSLGGAIGLQAMGFDDRIAFGVIESTFSDFRTITHDYVQYFAKINIRFLTNYLVTRAGKIAGFDTEDARPSAYCKKINQPILVVHGALDKRINIKYGKENFDNIPSTKKQFLEIKKANHLNVWDVGGEDYFNTVIAFINKQG